MVSFVLAEEFQHYELEKNTAIWTNESFRFIFENCGKDVSKLEKLSKLHYCSSYSINDCDTIYFGTVGNFLYNEKSKGYVRF